MRQYILLGTVYLTVASAAVEISPPSADVRAGETVRFSAKGATAPKWKLSGSKQARNVELGTITPAGFYTAPALPPNPNLVVVRVKNASATVRILNPAPVLKAVAPQTIHSGTPFNLSVTGSGFLPSSQALLNGKPVNVAFVSNTELTLTGTETFPPGTKLQVAVVNPDPGEIASKPVGLVVALPVRVSLTPGNTTVRCGTELKLNASITNDADKSVNWLVNSKPGGDDTDGTIDSNGLYHAPSIAPDNPVVTINAVANADPGVKASIQLKLADPTPVVHNAVINPNNQLTLTGSGFARHAVAYMAGQPLETTWDSPSQLTAISTVPAVPGELAAIKVANTKSLVSASVAISLRSLHPLMSYAEATRFLKLTTWGPTPAAVVHLQNVGTDAWLAEQFQAPPSAIPDPADYNEAPARLQDAFFLNALTGPDQLRQRIAFALSEILVVSADKDRHYAQLAPYLRLLNEHALGNFHDLLVAITLNPAMGSYLDMVNNSKANPARNTVANENYARELMQLFTLGLVQLHDDGTPADVPEYDETTVKELAKVMTGWSYAPMPGYAGHWGNPENGLQPMVAYEDHHDTTEKNINLPVPCTIAAGGTARSDLDAAIGCILKQKNVAPFISYRLIQRLVMSDPPPTYVRRVSNVFRNTDGDLWTVVRAILSDPEASEPGAGKLQEPMLFATGLLRALDASARGPLTPLRIQSTVMGQQALAPPSVFSYFSPFYRTNGVLAPEFQGYNAATAIARLNFIYKAVHDQLGPGIRVNLTNWDELASDPVRLLDAINIALYGGQMSEGQKSVILAAMAEAKDPKTRVRTAVYIAAAAPQYEVAQ